MRLSNHPANYLKASMQITKAVAMTAFQFNGGADGTRTRDLQRDRLAF